MVYRGKVHNGLIVIDGASRLPEGTVVTIEPIEQPPTLPGNAQGFLATNAHWHGTDEEVRRLLAELKQSKQEELRGQFGASEPQF